MSKKVRLSFNDKSRVRDELLSRDDTQFATLDELANQCAAKLQIPVTKCIVRGICRSNDIPYKGLIRSVEHAVDTDKAIIVLANAIAELYEKTGVAPCPAAISNLANQGTLFQCR